METAGMTLTSTALREQLAQRPWTAYNIRLTPEIETLPGQPDFLQTDPRLHAILRTLSLLYYGDIRSLRIVDLGCLEGGFSLALAQRGADVLGIDARSLNIEKAMLLKEHFYLPNLWFVQADVKDFSIERFGRFDVVLALGILYHLDDPVPWLAKVVGATRSVLVVDSHFAPADDHSLQKVGPHVATPGPLETVRQNGHDYEGRWTYEFAPGTDPEPRLWSSHSNYRSFWLTKQSLLQAMTHSGCDLVFEQHDYSAERHDWFATEFVRMMCWGLKLNGLRQSGILPGDGFIPSGRPDYNHLPGYR
jgi:SAM-dependent methyltransferase